MFTHEDIHERKQVESADAPKEMCNVDGLYASVPIEVSQQYSTMYPPPQGI